MNLILLEAHEVGADGCATLEDDRARHIREILKAEPGKPLRVGLLGGALGLASVVRIENRSVLLACSFDQPPPPPPPRGPAAGPAPPPPP